MKYVDYNQGRRQRMRGGYVGSSSPLRYLGMTWIYVFFNHWKIINESVSTPQAVLASPQTRPLATPLTTSMKTWFFFLALRTNQHFFSNKRFVPLYAIHYMSALSISCSFWSNMQIDRGCSVNPLQFLLTFLEFVLGVPGGRGSNMLNVLFVWFKTNSKGLTYFSEGGVSPPWPLPSYSPESLPHDKQK